MAKCAYCGTTVLFGGKKTDGFTFCNATCLAKGQVMLVAKQVPDEAVSRAAQTIYSGPCPVCKGQSGPIDVHTSHTVTSFILMTSWSSSPRVSCKSCGVKSQLGAMAHSLFLGWWGFPWGILITPVQVVKNVIGMARRGESHAPSTELERMVRLNIASQALHLARDPQR